MKCIFQLFAGVDISDTGEVYQLFAGVDMLVTGDVYQFSLPVSAYKLFVMCTYQSLANVDFVSEGKLLSRLSFCFIKL